MKRLLAVAALVALAFAAPAAAFMQGEESGDPCGGHQPGESWTDAGGGMWTCMEYGWTDGWAYYGIRRAEYLGGRWDAG